MKVAAVVYFGLLPALLFSSGEGIRLAPFPHAPETATETANPDRSSGHGYQKNALRIFGSKGGRWAAKKDSDRSPLLSPVISTYRPRGSTESPRPERFHRSPSPLMPSRAICSECGRAPPSGSANSLI